MVAPSARTETRAPRIMRVRHGRNGIRARLVGTREGPLTAETNAWYLKKDSYTIEEVVERTCEFKWVRRKHYYPPELNPPLA